MTENDAAHQQALRFIVVGSSAASVHFLIVLALVQRLQLPPLLANVIAFFVAFNLSYAGHHFWTFSHETRSHTQSLPRFLLVAAGSFCLNEWLYFLLLRYAPLPYWLSLGIILALVAMITFLFSKFWVFTSHQ